MWFPTGRGSRYWPPLTSSPLWRLAPGNRGLVGMIFVVTPVALGCAHALVRPVFGELDAIEVQSGQVRYTRSARLLGAVVLVAVLVLAAAVARILAPPVGGRAVAAPVAGAPMIGDCVATNPFLSPLPDQVPSAVFGECSQPHAGEVVGVAVDRKQFPQMIVDRISVPDPRGCAGAAIISLGLAGVSDAVQPWSIREVAPVDVVGPDLRQQAAGQSWVACVAYSSPGNLSQPLHQLFVRGQLPAAFGTCETDLVGSCAHGHTDETFADVDLTYAMPAAQTLVPRCTALIGAVTRMPDVTAGGRLQVIAELSYYDVAGHGHPGYPPDHQPATAVCGLHLLGGGELVSTLVGLGAGPLPLAS